MTIVFYSGNTPLYSMISQFLFNVRGPVGQDQIMTQVGEREAIRSHEFIEPNIIISPVQDLVTVDQAHPGVLIQPLGYLDIDHFPHIVGAGHASGLL